MSPLFARLLRDVLARRRASGPGIPARRSPLPARSGRPARLVAINRFFPPDDAPTGRLLADLARHLAGQGVAVTIVTSRPRVPGRLPEVDGLRVVHVACPGVGSSGLPGRLVAYLSFALGAALRLLVEVRSGDTVLVKTDPPLMSLLAAPIAAARGAALVTWCQDLFPEVATAVGLLDPGSGAETLLARLRDRSLMAARLNVVVSRSMAARLRLRGIPAERIAVVPNWADEDWIHPRDGRSVRRRTGLAAASFVIGYAGTLGRVHDAAPLQVLVRRLCRWADTAFLFVGSGIGMDELRRRVEEDGLGRRVRFLPPQPRVLLAETLTAADLHLVGLRPECEGLSFPSKLYGALAAARPVLFIGDLRSEVAGILTSAGAGLAVDGSDPEAMVEAVARLRAEAGMRGRAARLLFERRYRRAQALAAWSRCLQLAAPAQFPPIEEKVVGGTGIEPVTPRV